MLTLTLLLLMSLLMLLMSLPPDWIPSWSSSSVAMYERSLGVSSAEAAVPSVLYLISDASKNMTGAVIERRLVPGESG